MEKRFYKKAWFAALILFFILVLAVVVIMSLANKKEDDEKAVNTSNNSLKSVKAIEETRQPEKQLSSITASYSGDTSEGVAIDNNSQITVTATFDDGSTEVVSGWSVENSSSLVAEQTSSYKVSYGGISCNVDITCTSPSGETYKAQCESVEFKEFAWNANSYKDKCVKFTGKVVSCWEKENNGVLIKVGISDAENNSWANTVLVFYTYKDEEQRCSIDNTITFYGKYAGYVERSPDGDTDDMFIKINAEYIDLN